MSVNHWFDMNTYKEIMDNYNSKKKPTTTVKKSTTKKTTSAIKNDSKILSTEPLLTTSSTQSTSTKTSTTVSTTTKKKEQNIIETSSKTAPADKTHEKDSEKEIVPDGRQVNLNIGVSANENKEAPTKNSKNEEKKNTNAQSHFIDALAKSSSSTTKTSTTQKSTTTLKPKGKLAEKTVPKTESTTILSSNKSTITTSTTSSSFVKLENQTLGTYTKGSPLLFGSNLNSKSTQSVPYSAAGSLLIGLVILAVIETLCIVVLLICRLKKKGSITPFNESTTTNATMNKQNLNAFNYNQYSNPVDSYEVLHSDEVLSRKAHEGTSANKNSKMTKKDSVSSAVNRHVEGMTKQLKGSGTFAGKSRTKEHHTNPFKTV